MLMRDRRREETSPNSDLKTIFSLSNSSHCFSLSSFLAFDADWGWKARTIYSRDCLEISLDGTYSCRIPVRHDGGDEANPKCWTHSTTAEVLLLKTYLDLTVHYIILPKVHLKPSVLLNPRPPLAKLSSELIFTTKPYTPGPQHICGISQFRASRHLTSSLHFHCQHPHNPLYMYVYRVRWTTRICLLSSLATGYTSLPFRHTFWSPSP